jgi:hypothetical protein
VKPTDCGLAVLGILLTVAVPAPPAAAAPPVTPQAAAAASGDDPWAKLPLQGRRLREAFKQAFGSDPTLPREGVCTEKSCTFYSKKIGEQKPGARLTDAYMNSDESTKKSFDTWQDSDHPWAGLKIDKNVVAKATRILDLGPAWKGAVGKSNWSMGGRYYTILYQGKDYPKGEAGGDLICTGAYLRVFHTVYGTAMPLSDDGVNPDWGEKFYKEIERLTDIAKGELEQKLRTFAKVAGSSGVCGPATVEEVAVPELPLVIPAADLGGDYKQGLTAKRDVVLQALEQAKNERKLTCQDGPVNSLKTLQAWFTENKPKLDAEQKARAAAEEFFTKLLPRHYPLMTDAERTKVEQGLLDRGLALRRFRTVQRGVMRDKDGAGTITSCKDMDAYYTALSRATWAVLELEAVIRMSGQINTQRVIFYGSTDLAELTERQPDPRLVAAIESARRRQFETVIDMGIMAVLGSEIRHDAMLEARKERMYGIKEMWAGDKHPDPSIEKALKDNLSGLWKSMDVVTSTVNVLGFGLSDVVTGMGADVIRTPLYGVSSLFNAPWANNFKSRAEKLEQQRSENWDKTMLRILALRLLRQKSPADVQTLAEKSLGRDLDPGMIAAALGKVDPATIKELIEDRTFVESTDGSFYRILGCMLIDFRQRGRMEMAIAREKTRMIRRDMESALRAAEGLDPDRDFPDSGLCPTCRAVSWGTLISPTAWSDITSKAIKGDHQARGAAINLKAAQMADMFKVEAALYHVNFDFAALPPDMAKLHIQLLAGSAPYIHFVQRMTQERRAWDLHGWRRVMPPVLIEVGQFLKQHFEALSQNDALTEARAEERRTAPLIVMDYINAWDLSGALSYTKHMATHGCDGECAKTYAAAYHDLLAEYAWDRFRSRQISFLRPLGDLGFFSAILGAASKTMATEAAAGAAGTAQKTTIRQFLFESLNPFAPGAAIDIMTGKMVRDWSHAVQAVVVQSLTEVAVADVAAPAMGHEYEPLLTQTVMLAFSKAIQSIQRKKFKNIDKLLEQAIVTEKAQNGEHFDVKQYLNDLLNMPVVRAQKRLEKVQEHLEEIQEPAVRDALDRQARADQRVVGMWGTAQKAAEKFRKLRESLVAAVKGREAVAPEKVLAAHRMLENAVLPPTVARYEALLQTRAAELFDPDGRHIDRIREDFRAMRSWTRPQERLALDRLEVNIDQIRYERFFNAITEFLTAHGAQIEGEGVILNGTRPGNPEYKGIFSDLDFTVVTKQGVDPAAIRTALDTIFKKQSIALNSKVRGPSADMEAMVQDFLPGEVRTIKTWKEFEQWALQLPKDPHRYLSSGAAEWVGLYNYLNGATVKLVGGKAVIEPTPNLKLIPPPEVDPMGAHGLVLDLMRFDTFAKASSVPHTEALGDMIGDRAKVTLRYVDAIIRAKYPDLLKMRTREAAQQKGYHGLLVEDALRLVTEKILTPQEFELVQRLAEIKTGKTVFQTLGANTAPEIEASRGALEHIWAAMDDLGRRAYSTTREVYLDRLEYDAKGLGDSPKAPEALQTIAFRGWNAAAKINTKEQPQKLASLSGDAGADPKAMKRQEQTIIGVDSKLDNFNPLPAQKGIPVVEVDPNLGNGERPAEGAEPRVRPTALRTAAMPVREPAVVKSDSLAEIFIPMGDRAYLRGDGYMYLNGEKVGIVRDMWDEPYQKPNEVVAYKLGRWLDVNIPYTESGMRQSDGEVISITRWVKGSVMNADAVRLAMAGKNPAGEPLGLKMTLEQHQMQVRYEYIGTRLLSALMGEYDRKGNNFTVTQDAHLVGLDFKRAQPFDAVLTLKDIAEQTRKRFEGESYPREGHTTDRYRKLDQDVGVKYEDIAKVWEAMKAKLLDPKGNLNEQQLEKLAEYYGDKKREVLETWKHRIRTLDTVLGRVFLPENGVAAALKMDEAALRANKDAQKELFQAAKWMRASQESLVQGILAELNLSPDAAYAILKRDSFEAFIAGVLEKMHRKGYDKVSKMDDMARGRINLPTGADVKRLVAELEKQGVFVVDNEKQPGKAQGPKEREGIEMGYPRYHAILKDVKTGFTFEWQIGTQRTTDFFELPGIELGTLKLKEGMKPNIHDIEYDVFKYLQESDKPGYGDLAKELRIPEFRKRVAEYAAKTFEGSTVPEAQFKQSLAEYHKEASEILKNLIDRKGVEFVQGFFH